DCGRIYRTTGRACGPGEGQEGSGRQGLPAMRLGHREDRGLQPHDMACPGRKCHICWKCLETSDTSKLCYNHL
ncbi:hypothetical protein MCOR31_006418, partial [Pyricularia oryzae]